MKPGKDQLGDRIKKYENSWRIKLPERLPVILRLDGVSFHSYAKGCKKPFDENIVSCMNDTALYLCNNIQNVVAAYIQSDEISFLINNYKQLNTESWHGNNIQKMSSVAASMASAYFTSISDRIFGKLKVAHFDCRAFVVPKEEVNNALLHRQQDATRNSIQMLARSLYSHNQCNLKNTSQLQEMCWQKGFNWNDLPTYQKRGRCVVKEKMTITGINVKTNEPFTVERGKWKVDNEIPIFSKDPNYITRLI